MHLRAFIQSTEYYHQFITIVYYAHGSTKNYIHLNLSFRPCLSCTIFHLGPIFSRAK